MAFRVCENSKRDDEGFACGASLDKPTVEQDLITGQYCECCGFKQSQYQQVEDWLVELSIELSELKTCLAQGTSQLSALLRKDEYEQK